MNTNSNKHNVKSSNDLQDQIKILSELKTRLKSFLESYEQSEEDEKARLIQEYESEVQKP